MIRIALVFLLLFQDAKPLPPDAAAQKQAEKAIRDVFKADYAKKDVEARRALGEKLLKNGVETKDDPVSRFVLLREARDVAAEALDFKTIFAAVDAIAETHDIKRDEMKEEALKVSRKSARTPEDAALTGEGYLALAEGAVDLDVALRAARAAADIAKTAKDPDLASRANDRAREIPEVRKERDSAAKAELTLSITPGDAESNLTLGRFLCFAKGDWDKGLPMLQKCGNAALAEVATRDATNPTDAAEQAKAGDAWIAAADKERGALDKRRYQGRARHWYEKALPTLTGLARAKVEKALENLDKVAGPRGILDLLRMVDLTKDSVRGPWAQTGGVFSCPGGNLQLPYLPPDEYDLKLVVTMPPQNGNTLCIGLPGPDKQIMLVVDGPDTHGLEMIDGQYYQNNETTSRGKIFIDDKPRTLLCSMRRARITVTIEGKKIVDWAPDWSRVTLRGNWVTPEKRAIFIGALGRPSFHQALLTPLSGQGKKLR